jgi:hypothetical protein
MGLEDRDYMSDERSGTRKVDVCPHCGHWVSVCTCRKYTPVPFGGGCQPETRGLSTADAERKGLLTWDGSKFVLPKPIINAEETISAMDNQFVAESTLKYNRPQWDNVSRFILNAVATVLILGAVSFLLWWLVS